MEEEAPVGCSLTGMHVGFAFSQRELNEQFGFRSTHIGADEEMVNSNTSTTDAKRPNH